MAEIKFDRDCAILDIRVAVKSTALLRIRDFVIMAGPSINNESRGGCIFSRLKLHPMPLRIRRVMRSVLPIGFIFARFR